MQCPSCGKTGFVVISNKRFCSNCGAKVNGPASPATMSEIKSSGGALDLRSSSPTGPANTSSISKPASNARTATQLHGLQVGASKVLDLRNAPKPAAAPSAPADPVTPSSPAAAPTPVIPVVEKKISEPAPGPAPTQVPVSPGASLDHVVNTAPAVPEPTPAPGPVMPARTPEPTPEPKSVTPTPEPAASTVTPTAEKSPLVSKLPVHPALAKPEVMPSAVTTQIEDLSKKAATAPAPPSPPQSPALQEALAAAKQSTNAPKAVKFGAALTAVALMVGVVWFQNSPKLAFRNAALQAGIDASLPTYIPSSFHRNGDPRVASGQISLNFKNTHGNDELNITQKRSNWDSNSLRENFITKQTDKFLAVQGQGLTIYLYSDKATWINHGVWYQLSGTSKLSREQILKVAYGL